MIRTTDLPATTRLDTTILPERRFPWTLRHRCWERDLFVLRYQEASDARQDEGPELLALFPAGAEALAFIDDGPIVPLTLVHHRQVIVSEPWRSRTMATVVTELPL